jgi:radical SAM superfamily enzyme YgiQ (UPF0313 family)
LTAALRRRGLCVVQKDLGIEIATTILSAVHMRRAFTAAVERIRHLTTSREDRAYQARFWRIAGWAGYLADHVEEARRVMQSADLYDLGRYRWAVAVLDLACELAALPYHPATLSGANYDPGAECSVAALGDAAAGVRPSLYQPLLMTDGLKEALNRDPILVGISVTYRSQMEPAFILARLVKSMLPDVHVTLGGALITRLEAAILSDPAWLEQADSYVVGEGETALTGLAESLLAGSVPRDLPNTIVRVAGRPHTGGTGWLEDVETLECPDFDGLDLEAYLSPEPVLLLSSTRGCYHGKCAFCDVSRNTRSRYRPMTRSKVVANLARLRRRYGARRFSFADDAMPPAVMAAVSQAVMAEMPDVTWQAEARFERALTPEFLATLQRGGCRQLMFGLESACQRVLDAMDKDNSAEHDLVVLHACADTGIAVNLQTFVGFPGETREEARQTIDFLREHRERIASFGFTTFSLYQGTPVSKQPGRFGVTLAERADSHDPLAPCAYSASVGISHEEAEQLQREGLDELQEAYGSRLHCLAGSVGAHSLLHFSHYPYEQLARFWAELDADRWRDRPEFEDLVFSPSSSLLTSHAPDGLEAAVAAFCTDTGAAFDLSAGQSRLLDVCDGRRTLGEAVSLWAGTNDEPEADVRRLLSGFATARAMLRNGLLVERARAGSGSCP